jgi:DNA-directed RNA polymerase specialized sigma subunit
MGFLGGFVMISLYEMVKRAKSGDEQSLEYLILKFDPIINSISRKLNMECAKTDMVIFFIKLIKGMNIENIKNLSDGALVKYVEISLRRKYIKMNNKDSIIEVELNDVFNSHNNEYTEIEFKIFLDEIENKKVINKKQNYVLLEKYFNQNTEQEIADELKISRQAVNKMNRLAIKNIREYLYCRKGVC